jgi:hypothetical protein
MATVGKPPPFGSSFQLIDGRWILQVANGGNMSYQAGITAHAGGTKAAALQLPANVALFQIDTVATTGDSVLLPAANPGTIIEVFNNGAATLNIFGRGTDIINQTATATQYLLTAGQVATFFCAKTGVWAAAKTA